MTISELLQYLRENSTPDEWVVSPKGPSILRSRLGYCPICWAGRQMMLNTEGLRGVAYVIGRRIGMAEADISCVMNAADNHLIDAERVAMRLLLLEACGLVKPSSVNKE